MKAHNYTPSHPCQTCTGPDLFEIRHKTALLMERMFPWDKKGLAVWLHKYSNVSSTMTKTLKVSRLTQVYHWDASILRALISLVLCYVHQLPPLPPSRDSMWCSKEERTRKEAFCFLPPAPRNYFKQAHINFGMLLLPKTCLELHFQNGNTEKCSHLVAH